MKTYYVYGDYGYESQSDLFGTTSLNEAKAWANKYARNEDLGGHRCIEVIWFASDGECFCEHRIEEEEEYDYFSD